MDFEFPTMEECRDHPVDAAYAEFVWKRYLEKSPGEIERFRHCMGCQHLHQAGGAYLVCCYLLRTGRKRPCRFGVECPVKSVPEGFRYPDGYEDWCAEIDNREIAEGRAGRGRGRSATWDTAWAKDLFDRGFSASEICEILGITASTFAGYANQHLWHYNEDGTRRRKTFPHHLPEEIEAEKEAFARHLKEQGKPNNLEGE